MRVFFFSAFFSSILPITFPPRARPRAPTPRCTHTHTSFLSLSLSFPFPFSINNAWVAHGRGWVLEADDNPIVKLAGAALDFHLNWRDEIAFADGERFAYRKPKSVLGGLVVGGMNLTHTVREEREREREKER